MSSKHKTVWGAVDPERIEDRILADLSIIKGVLQLAYVADHADRRHSDVIEVLLNDDAISDACFGASRIADDLDACIEELVVQWGQSKAKLMEGKQ